MPPAVLVDLRSIDLGRVEFGPDEIRRRNPHRHEMEMLTGILAYRPEQGIIVGENRIPEDAFWARGHIPGRPLLPGVLMVEAAAQLCSFYWRVAYPDMEKFFGFGGIENARFRGTVVPGDRLIVVGHAVQVRPRRAIFDTQGFVRESMVFDAKIIGIPF
ncbi:MAG: 3-hydroxyacyl-ACP dehydratase FabZ family protein [Planctomycetota bacterium]